MIVTAAATTAASSMCPVVGKKRVERHALGTLAERARVRPSSLQWPHRALPPAATSARGAHGVLGLRHWQSIAIL